MTENPYRPSQNAEPARAWDEGYRAAIADLALVAGENPYDPWSSVEAHDGWRDGAACGVAAERAQWEDARSLLEAIARASDPGSEGASDEAWRFAYENASESAARVLAALAPERTTTPEPEGENA